MTNERWLLKDCHTNIVSAIQANHRGVTRDALTHICLALNLLLSAVDELTGPTIDLNTIDGPG